MSHEELFRVMKTNCFVATTEWKCISCTFSNPHGDTCQMCNTPRDKTQKSNKWNCPLCTFENETSSNSCSMCNTPKPSLPLFQQCDYLMRLLYAMKYYRLLDIANIPSNIDIFTSFQNEVYPNMIDDYHHVISNHEEHLQQFHDEIISDENYGVCNYSQCKLSERYRREHRPSPSESTAADYKTSLLCDMLDAFHHWLFHMYQSGMRVKKLNQEILAYKSVDEEKEESKYIDHEFKRIKASITNQREKNNVLDHRFTTHGNDKFQLQVTANSSEAGTKKNETFVDLFLMSIDRESVSPRISQRLLTYMITEGFDTDGLIEDLHAKVTDSNLLGLFDEVYIHSLVQNCFEDLTMPTGFSTGFIWFYWPWYKDKTEIVNNGPSNSNDYSGYRSKADELYVPAKYGNYKEELLKHLSVGQFRNIIIPKVNALMKSIRVRRMKANSAERWLYYGIQKYTSITSNHIMSLITYTDFTNYSRTFSSTFRKTFITESLASVRERNREFWWQSKLFRETIEIYGTPSYADTDSSGGKFRHGLAGPFHTGVNCQLFIPDFAIRLCAPTSTSLHIEVAMNFATDGGIIIQLNNNGGEYGKNLHGLDVSWLSRYPDEDERVWCGGYFTIKVEGVRVMKTNKNYESVFKSLYRFDCMASGVKLTYEEKEAEIEDNLPSFKKDSNTTEDLYISSTFQSYLKKKQEIIIQFNYLIRQKLPQKWLDWIIQSGIERQITAEFNLSTEWIYNLLSVKVFEIFSNLKTIVMETRVGEERTESYPINLLHLLDVICVSSKWDQIVVQQSINQKKFMGWISWIDKIWQSMSTVIKQEYKKRGLVIKFKQMQIGISGKSIISHQLIITRDIV